MWVFKNYEKIIKYVCIDADGDNVEYSICFIRTR